MKLSDQTETKVYLIRFKSIAKYGIRTRHWVKTTAFLLKMQCFCCRWDLVC